MLGKTAERQVFSVLRGVGRPELAPKVDFHRGQAIADADDMLTQVQFQFYYSLHFALNIFGFWRPRIKKSESQKLLCGHPSE